MLNKLTAVAGDCETMHLHGLRLSAVVHGALSRTLRDRRKGERLCSGSEDAGRGQPAAAHGSLRRTVIHLPVWVSIPSPRPRPLVLRRSPGKAAPGCRVIVSVLLVFAIASVL